MRDISVVYPKFPKTYSGKLEQQQKLIFMSKAVVCRPETLRCIILENVTCIPTVTRDPQEPDYSKICCGHAAVSSQSATSSQSLRSVISLVRSPITSSQQV